MEQSKVTIFVGGLSDNLKEEKLEEYFSQYAENLYARVLRNPKTGLSKGYGFLHLEDKQAAKRILQKKDHSINGRKIDCQIAKASKSLIGGNQQHRIANNKNRLFVAGLSSEVCDEDLNCYFSGFREVKSAYVIRDYETKKSKLFGYVVFNTEEAALGVLGISDHVILGKKIKLSKFNEKKGNNKGSRAKGKKTVHNEKKERAKLRRKDQKHQESHKQLKSNYSSRRDYVNESNGYLSDEANNNNFPNEMNKIRRRMHDSDAYRRDPIYSGTFYPSNHQNSNTAHQESRRPEGRQRFQSDHLGDHFYNHSPKTFLNSKINRRNSQNFYQNPQFTHLNRQRNQNYMQQNYVNVQHDSIQREQRGFPGEFNDFRKSISKLDLIKEFSKKIQKKYDHNFDPRRTRFESSLMDQSQYKTQKNSSTKKHNFPPSKFSFKNESSISPHNMHNSRNFQKTMHSKNFNQNSINKNCQKKTRKKIKNQVTSLQFLNDKIEKKSGQIFDVTDHSRKYKINIPTECEVSLAEHGISSEDLSFLILTKFPCKFEILEKSIFDFPLNLKKMLEIDLRFLSNDIFAGEFMMDCDSSNYKKNRYINSRGKGLLHSLMSDSSFNSHSQF